MNQFAAHISNSVKLLSETEGGNWAQGQGKNARKLCKRSVREGRWREDDCLALLMLIMIDADYKSTLLFRPTCKSFVKVRE